MSLKYIILNLLILFVVVMVAVENYDTWTQPIELLHEKQETVKKPAAKAENLPPLGANKEPASLRSFIVISEKNIFSPERKDFPILGVEKSNPVTRPQVILYGVTMAGDYQAASVVNPGRPLRKGEREMITLKMGEKIGEYKLAKIQPDRITMESNGDSFEVFLYDSRNPKKRTEVKTEVKPSTVTSTQPAPTASTSPAAGPATIPATAPATAPSPAPTAAPAPAPIEKAPPTASVDKPREPPQQQLVRPPSSPAAKRLPPSWQLRRPVPNYPSTSPPAGDPGQATQ